MRTITLSMQPRKPGYTIKVMDDASVRNHLQDWSVLPGASRHLSAVVGEGSTIRIGLFEGDRLSSVTSVSVRNGSVMHNGVRVLPVIGTTWEGLFQDVRIIPSLFARKEKSG